MSRPPKNKDMEPVEPAQMNIYQSNTYNRKDLSWQHFDDESWVQERQQPQEKETS